MKTLFIALAFIATPYSSFAHEGHDKTPGAVSAPHGGSVQGTSELYIELVTTKDGVIVYPISHDGKALPTSGLSLKGEFQVPRKGKAEKVTFVPAQDSFSAKIDAKGAYRYSLELKVAPKGKKEESLKFNVEPK